MKRLFCIVLFLLLKFQAFSNHIVGGEMIYDDLGGGNYRITLKVYRDCFGGGALFDGVPNGPGPAFITVYGGSNTFVNYYDLGAPLITKVPSAFNNACIDAPNSICVEEGIYTYTLNLPPKVGGYTVVYQRCCRNSIIENLVNPSGQGASYFAKIPGPEDALVNSSPRFSKFPPIYICRNVAVRFDHAAVDPGGDQLVYSLCAPFAGLDGCCPRIGLSFPQSGSSCPSPPSNCPGVAPPPPYLNVLFSAPYSGIYPIDGNPAFSIDALTGQLAGTPTWIGQYVVGVCVQEFRNNKLINTHFRDFQFTVINCTVNVQSAIADQKQQCQGQTISFTNQSLNNSSTPVYHWNFGVPSLLTDTSNLFSPTYLYPDTGIYILTLITNPGKPCTDTLKKPVYVYPPLKINYKRPNRQCFTNNSFDFKTEGIYLPQTTYQWSFTFSATPSSSILKDPTGIHFTTGGLYFVKLKAKQFACRDSFTDSVRVIRKPKAKINNLQSGLCDPALVGFSNGSTSDLPISYLWTFSNGKTSNAFEPTQVFSPAGTYVATLLVETKEVCRDTSVAVLSNILVNPKPVASFTFTPQETSIFEPDISIVSQTNDNGTSTKFDFGDGQNSNQANNVHAYTDFGNFKITQIVTNSYNCSDTASDFVKILPEFRFWIPNCFTPDDNNKNDFFMPVTIGVSNFEFEVFNRWGQKIFRTTNPLEGWNGSFKGLESPQGIYTWKISFKNVAAEKTETHLGHVTLIRSPQY